MGFEEIVVAHEPAIRLAFFLGVFVAVALWETAAPRRRQTVLRRSRWPANLALVALNTVLLRVLFPFAGAGMAAFAAAKGWGLFNYVEVPYWLAVVAALIALDFAIWAQHVMFHAIPALWRVHRVHHADPEYDLTTGARFHPIEIVLSMGIKFAVIAVLGPPVVAVVIFEVLLNATSMFNHGNVRLRPAIDRTLRWFVVTPDMHRVHHSVDDDETNSNFGFNLPWWDRLLGTYRNEPRAGHEGMTIGIRGDRDARHVTRLPGMLMLPFSGDVEGYAINRRTWLRKETRK